MQIFLKKSLKNVEDITWRIPNKIPWETPKEIPGCIFVNKIFEINSERILDRNYQGILDTFPKKNRGRHFDTIFGDVSKENPRGIFETRSDETEFENLRKKCTRNGIYGKFYERNSWNNFVRIWTATLEGIQGSFSK